VRVVLRADAPARGGIGHVMRSRALGQALVAAGHDVVLATKVVPATIRTRLEEDGITVRLLDPHAPTGHAAQWGADAERIRAIDPDWLVLDGYDLDIGDRTWSGVADRILVVDDLGWTGAFSSAVVNGNLYASLAMYPEPREETELLLGPGYALIGREFVDPSRRTEASDRPGPKRVVISFGGSDPDNLTLQTMQALLGLDSRPVLQVVVGPSHPDPASIDAAAAVAPTTVGVVQSPTSMAAILRDADLVVGGAGTSVLECSALGIPVVAIQVADNQRLGASALARLGLGVSLGDGSAFDARSLQNAVRQLLDNPTRLREMASRGPEMVDGRGAVRTVRYLENPDLSLRAATMNDAEILFRWANDPAVRAASFHSDPIEWEAHRTWLAGRLGDPNALIVIVECGGVAIGSVRFVIAPGSATISITVSPDHRARGLGARMIALASRRMFQRSGIDRIDAWIKPENDPSRSAFILAGYTRAPATQSTPDGGPADRYVIARPSGG
jgi:UDP-2,4-diacetamido-2,4,6-trideoxy-beta-L-altropyranose hydrolase